MLFASHQTMAYDGLLCQYIANDNFTLTRLFYKVDDNVVG